MKIDESYKDMDECGQVHYGIYEMNELEENALYEALNCYLANGNTSKKMKEVVKDMLTAIAESYE